MKHFWWVFWLLLHGAAWMVPAAVLVFLWPRHVFGLLAGFGLHTAAGRPGIVQPGAILCFLIAAAALVAVLLLSPRWATAIDEGRGGSRPLVWLLCVVAAASMLVSALFVMWPAVPVGDFNAFDLPAFPLHVVVGGWLLLAALFVGAHLKSVVSSAIEATLRRRDPHRPGLREFRGTAVAMPAAGSVRVPVTGEPALAWHVNALTVAKGTERWRTTVEDGSGRQEHVTSYVRYKRKDEHTATWDSVDFGIALPDGTVIQVSDEARFWGIPVTDPRPIDAALPRDIVAELEDSLDGDVTSVKYQVFAITQGQPMKVAGGVERDDQGRLWLVNHPQQEATVEPA